jgi:microcystin-dependent protein
VVGYAFGGSGGTFNVPDFRGRVAIGAGAGAGLSNRVLGATGGEETHALSIGELAAHQHAGVNHLHSFTGVDHLHYCPGVDHLHGDDHYHNIGAGQFNHAHTVSNVAMVATGNGWYGSGNCAFGTAGTSAATLPAGNSVYKSQTGFSAATGASDRSLAFWSGAADRSLASNTAGADRDLTTGATGSGTGHNTMQPFAVVTKIIKI